MTPTPSERQDAGVSTVTPLTAREVETRSAYPHLFDPPGPDDIAIDPRIFDQHIVLGPPLTDSQIAMLQRLFPFDGYHGAELPR